VQITKTCKICGGTGLDPTLTFSKSDCRWCWGRGYRLDTMGFLLRLLGCEHEAKEDEPCKDGS
jgi:hypothetical protein